MKIFLRSWTDRQQSEVVKSAPKPLTNRVNQTSGNCQLSGNSEQFNRKAPGRLTARWISTISTVEPEENVSTLQSQPIKSGHAPVNGISMYYEVHGRRDGVPLVLLHGGGSTIDVTFSRVLPVFAGSRRVIAVEEQGHGRTTDRDAPVTFESSDAERMRNFKDVPDELVRSVCAPTLIVLGDRDIVKPEHAVELARMISGARLLILPGGHGGLSWRARDDADGHPLSRVVSAIDRGIHRLGLMKSRPPSPTKPVHTTGPPLRGVRVAQSVMI